MSLSSIRPGRRRFSNLKKPGRKGPEVLEGGGKKEAVH